MVAGERSGDVYGAALAAALRARLPAIEIFGCGGDSMRQAQVETAVDAHQVSMIGVFEVLTGLPRAYRAFRSLLAEVDRRKPQLAVLIDFPGFNMRLAKKLKRRNIPVIYFVSPQIWAWKKWRIKQLKASIEKMLCIFDFEEAIYQRAGIPVEYIGHPLLDLVGLNLSRDEFFAKVGLDAGTPTVALLPGSRKTEVSYNLPPMLDAASRLALTRKIQFVIPIAASVDPAWLEAMLVHCFVGRATVRAVSRFSFDALQHSDVAVVASGTATLEAALCERPMVVVYRVSPLTWLLGKFLLDVPYYSMVNLLAGKPIVTELIQSEFTARNVAGRVEYLLDQPAAFAKMIEDLRALRPRLGPGGAIERAARAIVGALERRETSVPVTSGIGDEANKLRKDTTGRLVK
jgi:lipid-A-disaccharide synthase